ncbi:SNX21 [Acanthosepion pharaonis]|uniref:SNX21 n=1 Tax=Acanthosepion pharaonis TaxID=158019 RepID=A0A812D2H8_ACAPH|nr:SNX21 [Sepia pharaonis]
MASLLRKKVANRHISSLAAGHADHGGLLSSSSPPQSPHLIHHHHQLGFTTGDMDSRDCSEATLSDQEELASLADEVDDDSFATLGTLSFSEDEDGRNSSNNTTYPIQKESSRSPEPVPFDGQYNGTERVSFEVTSADKIKDGRSAFVMYTVLISKNSGIDKMPTMIEKRYSDFDRLNNRLRKKFPYKMEDISFPKKLLTGNFTSETIARRSRAFEQYLTHLYSISDVRYSEDFANFFYLKELKVAYNLMFECKYSEAIPILEKCLPVQEKVHSDMYPDILLTLCAIAASYHQLERPYMAQRYAETALGCIHNTNREMDEAILVALLQLSIRVCWTLGKDKRDLESRLQALRQQGVIVENARPLMDVVKSRIRKKYQK